MQIVEPNDQLSTDAAHTPPEFLEKGGATNSLQYHLDHVHDMKKTILSEYSVVIHYFAFTKLHVSGINVQNVFNVAL